MHQQKDARDGVHLPGGNDTDFWAEYKIGRLDVPYKSDTVYVDFPFNFPVRAPLLDCSFACLLVLMQTQSQALPK